jgi:serpin B
MHRPMPSLIRRSAVLVALLAAVVLSASEASAAEPPRIAKAATEKSTSAPVADTAPVVRAVNALGQRALARMVGPKGERTAVLSPYGLATALELLALGAEGKEAVQLRAMLGPKGVAPGAHLAQHRALREALAAAVAPGLDLATANAGWLAARLQPAPAALTEAREAFGAPLSTADFAAPETLAAINGWAREATRGLVPKLLASLDPTTDLVLANAVYFKGRWQKAFDPAATFPGPFRRLDGTTREVPMMSDRLLVPYARQGGVHAVALPYVGGRFRLVVATATEAKASARFARRIAAKGGTAKLLAGLRFVPREVDVRLPRFRSEATADLGATLKAIGLGPAIDGRLRYRRFSACPLARLDVVQRVVLDVSESGTEAAAVTAVIGTRSLEAPARPQFSADRPFLVVLEDTATGLQLFIGLVTDPSAGPA